MQLGTPIFVLFRESYFGAGSPPKNNPFLVMEGDEKGVHVRIGASGGRIISCHSSRAYLLELICIGEIKEHKTNANKESRSATSSRE
jgi:hypothetical protein